MPLCHSSSTSGARRPEILDKGYCGPPLNVNATASDSSMDAGEDDHNHRRYAVANKTKGRPYLTQEKMTTSASLPWKPSTVANWTASTAVDPPRCRDAQRAGAAKRHHSGSGTQRRLH